MKTISVISIMASMKENDIIDKWKKMKIILLIMWKWKWKWYSINNVKYRK